MSAAIYTSTPIRTDVGKVPKFNASAFPCHTPDTKTVFLNGSYPEIEALCDAEGLTCKPFSEFIKPTAKAAKTKD